MPFHCSTITFDDAPIPTATRPGAASHSDAMLCASSAGPRVKTGRIELDSRRVGAHAAVSTSGVKPSFAPASPEVTSVKPRSASSSIHSRCSCSGTLLNGMVMP
jgi:hypothetical protein